MSRIFPGIDPYLEAQGSWPDLHTRTITYCSDAISDGLPEHYLVRIEERVQLIDRDAAEVRMIRPDLMIVRSSGNRELVVGGVAIEHEPMISQLTIPEEVLERFVEILRRADQSLVTVLELLSPDNKAAPGSLQYLNKRSGLLRSPVHLVELDFLVGGRRLPMAEPLPPGDAYALVTRGDRRPDCEVYAWSIRQPLTRIRVPLSAPDPDLILDLAAVYETAFERGGYARWIDYGAPLTTPLAEEDRAWAEGRTRAPR